MLHMILSLGAIYAYIPIIIIILFIAAAAGLSRGWDIFSMFGFAAIAGMGRGGGGTGRGLGRGGGAGKYAAGQAKATRFRSKLPGPSSAKGVKGMATANLGRAINKLGSTLRAKGREAL